MPAAPTAAASVVLVTPLAPRTVPRRLCLACRLGQWRLLGGSILILKIYLGMNCCPRILSNYSCQAINDIAPKAHAISKSSTYCVVLMPVDNCFVLRKLTTTKHHIKYMWYKNTKVYNETPQWDNTNETTWTCHKNSGTVVPHSCVRPKRIYTRTFITIATIAHKTQSRQAV